MYLHANGGVAGKSRGPLSVGVGVTVFDIVGGRRRRWRVRMVGERQGWGAGPW